MARTKISEFSATAADNTDIDGIDIAEGCAPSGINNAIRTLMADLKDMQTGASGDTFTFASLNATTANIDGGTIDGAVIGGSSAAAGTFTNLAYTGTLTGGTGVLNIGSGQIYKNASGNVGLGTTTPGYKIDARLGNKSLMNLYNTAAGSNDTSEAQISTFGTYWNILSSNASSFKWKTYNTERMTLSAGGYLGINSTSPTVPLDVRTPGSSLVNIYNTTATSNDSVEVQVSATNGAYWNIISHNASSFRWKTYNTERMRIDSNGNVQTTTGKWIGTSSGASYIPDDGVFGGTINNGGGFKITTGASERMRIDSSGNLLVGTTSASVPVSGFTAEVSAGGSGVYTRINIGHSSMAGNGESFARFLFNSAAIGTITRNSASTVAYNTSSDYRLKENIAPMTGALAKVSALKPVTYKWKVDGSDGQGFIAHELQAVVPDAVTGEKDAVDKDGKPVYQGVDTSFLVATLTKAIQEQQDIINSLKARLDVAGL